MWFPALRFALQSRSHAVRLRLAATPARVRAVGANGVCRRGGRERARCRGGHVLPCGCKVRRVQKTQACDGSRPAGAGVDTGRGPLRSTVQATPHSPPPQVWVFCSALCIQDVPGHGVDVCLFWPPRPTPAVLCTPICLSLRSTSVPSLCSLCPFLLSRGRVRAGVHFRHACSGRYAECWGEGPRGPIPAMMPTEPHGSGPPRGSAKEVSEEKAGPGPSAAHLEGPPAPSHRGRWPLPVSRRDRLCMRVFSRWRSRSPRGPQHVVLASG